VLLSSIIPRITAIRGVNTRSIHRHGRNILLNHRGCIVLLNHRGRIVLLYRGNRTLLYRSNRVLLHCIQRVSILVSPHYLRTTIKYPSCRRHGIRHDPSSSTLYRVDRRSTRRSVVHLRRSASRTSRSSVLRGLCHLVGLVFEIVGWLPLSVSQEK